jgi:hypothetical protein
VEKLALVLLCLSFAACASKNKAKDLDTKVNLSSEVNNGGVIGVKDGDMVYQRKVMMNEGLRRSEVLRQSGPVRRLERLPRGGQ